MKHAHDYVSDCECNECLLVRTRTLSARVAELEERRTSLAFTVNERGMRIKALESKLAEATQRADALQRVLDEARGPAIPDGYGLICDECGRYNGHHRQGCKNPTPVPAQPSAPVDMLLFCPQCHTQHVDAPDDRTAGWENPPHRSHLCHACGFVWRPADVATNGVQAIKTRGQNDYAPVAQPAPAVADDVARDAKRYWFLRNCVSYTETVNANRLDGLLEKIESLDGKAYAKAFDAAIDAAMLAASAPKESKP